jgi:hypothetical protein
MQEICRTLKISKATLYRSIKAENRCQPCLTAVPGNPQNLREAGPQNSDVLRFVVRPGTNDGGQHLHPTLVDYFRPQTICKCFYIYFFRSYHACLL